MNEKSAEHRINLSSSWKLLNETNTGRRINLGELHQADPTSLGVQRFFNRPSSLNESSRIFLEFSQCPRGIECEFNGEFLGVCDRDPCRFEITNTIRAGQNVIQLDRVAMFHTAGDLQPRVILVII